MSAKRTDEWYVRNRTRFTETVKSRIRDIKVEPSVCEIFGCGIVLSLQEQLFGRRCARHSEYAPDFIPDCEQDQ